jgi:hypothetical protein
MTQSASQATAFYRDVAAHRMMWTLHNEKGFPTARTSGGEYAVPFWSTLLRVQLITRVVPAYAGYEPFAVSWENFVTKWSPDLSKNKLKVGVNWSGKKATGYDLEPTRLVQIVKGWIEKVGST